MKLYHGSNQPIEIIDLSKGKKYKDFGQGFYATDLREQAEYWSRRIADRFGGRTTVTEFEFDFNAIVSDGLNVKIFDRPDKEWAQFVMANRRQGVDEFRHDYDMVIGPVADDKMARLFGLYDMNLIDLETVVSGLIYKELNSQYFFATARSLKYLKKL